MSGEGGGGDDARGRPGRTCWLRPYVSRGSSRRPPHYYHYYTRPCSALLPRAWRSGLATEGEGRLGTHDSRRRTEGESWEFYLLLIRVLSMGRAGFRCSASGGDKGGSLSSATPCTLRNPVHSRCWAVTSSQLNNNTSSTSQLFQTWAHEFNIR